MPLIDQIKEIFDLLKEAREDLDAWIDYAEENALDADTDDSYRIVAEIDSILHEVGY